MNIVHFPSLGKYLLTVLGAWCKTIGQLLPLILLLCVPYVANAKPTPAECRQLTREVADLTVEVRTLQAELSTAATGAKARIVAEIRRLNAILAPKRQKLATCKPPACTPKTICTQDPATSDPKCKICRRDNCDGTASVSHTC